MSAAARRDEQRRARARAAHPTRTPQWEERRPPDCGAHAFGLWARARARKPAFVSSKADGRVGNTGRLEPNCNAHERSPRPQNIKWPASQSEYFGGNQRFASDRGVDRTSDSVLAKRHLEVARYEPTKNLRLAPLEPCFCVQSLRFDRSPAHRPSRTHHLSNSGILIVAHHLR